VGAQEDRAENPVKKTEVMTFRLKADLIHNFGKGMKCSFPEHREGLTEWKAKIGDCVQDIYRDALFPKCSFWRNAGECTEWVIKYSLN